MTLNNVIDRIELICTSHNMIRAFGKGLEQDAQTDHTTKYPYAYLIDNGASISLTPSGLSTLNYRLKLMDLVNVSEDAKANEQDVQSDMFSIIQDIITQINYPAYNDWKISSSNQVELFVENDSDMVAGVYLDFSITIMFEQNRCEIPSDLIIIPNNNEDMKVYMAYYTATAADVLSGTIPGGDTVPPITGKKIIAAFRGPDLMRIVSNLPASDQATWNDVIVTPGISPNENEPFSFIFRNY